MKRPTVHLFWVLRSRVLHEVKKADAAAKIWSKLDSLYLSKVVPNRIFLKQKLSGFKTDENRLMNDSMDDLLKTVQDLENLSTKLDGEDLAVILLNSLHKSYASFVDTLKHSRQSLKTENKQWKKGVMVMVYLSLNLK